MKTLATLVLALSLHVPVISAAEPAACADPVADVLEPLVASHGLDGASLRLSTRQGLPVRWHAGRHDDDTRVPIASASKWLAALTFARLVEAGQLRWNSRVGEFFPDAPRSTHAITLEQLLSHTSGLPAGPAPCLSGRGGSLQDCARQILAGGPVAPAGTVFAYGGNGMQVAGAIAERATGQSWDTIFQREMVEPLGLAATDWRALARRPGYVGNPNPRIAGGARSSLADYGTVVDMVLARGRHAGRVFLTPETLDFMARDRSAGLRIDKQPETAAGMGYGLGQWVEGRDAGGGPRRVSSPGAFGFTPWVDESAGVAGVLLVRGRGRAMRPAIVRLQQACTARVLADPD
ncbi:serine hydrolase domain-containing protein [Arenimonas fontis]|nr:serine hydrolase domain-containing protein [Arenimonas fontis]